MTISVAQAQLFLLAFTRLMAILVQVPVLAGRVVPAQVKVALGLVLTLALIPWQPLPADAQSLSAVEMMVALFRELIIGLIAGYAAVLTFGVGQYAGELMGLGGGFGAGRVLNPTFESSGTVVDQLFILVMTLLFMVLNGHHLVLLAAQQTFVVLPVNSPLPAHWLGDPVQAAEPVLLTPDMADPEKIIAAACAACHGPGLAGGEKRGLLSGDFKHLKDPADLEKTIRDGVPASGMPPASGLLNEKQIGIVADFIRSHRKEGAK